MGAARSRNIKTCFEKTRRGNRFTDASVARRLAKDIGKRRNIKLEYYLCRFCGGYHIGGRKSRR